MTTLLVFDTATERLTIALTAGERVWSHAGSGGARASLALIPAILGLLREAGLGLSDLDAIGFCRGPGAFTGLRTACSVAQGLALGAGKPVLPLDSLRAVAEAARSGAPEFRAWVAIDARMDQLYAAEYEFEHERWRTVVEPMLSDCEVLGQRWQATPPQVVVGDGLGAFGARLETGDARRLPEARASAAALLGLAQRAWDDGAAVDPALALPLYVRDKVALTTREREAVREAAR